MAVRSLCRSISPVYNSLPVILPNRWFRLSFSTVRDDKKKYEKKYDKKKYEKKYDKKKDDKKKDDKKKDDKKKDDKKKESTFRTHMYTTKTYLGIGSKNWGDFMADYKPLWDIRSRSGAVVRPYTEDKKFLRKRGLLVVGNPTQIKLAFKFLNQALGLEVDSGIGDDRKNKMKNPYTLENNADKLIWQGYKRNFMGQFEPKKPRKTCIRGTSGRGKQSPAPVTGNPCPLCQMAINENYHVLYTDIEMLNHFICPHTWNVLGPEVTRLCLKRHKQIVATVEKSRSLGYLPFTLPLPSDEPVKHKRAGIPTDRNIKVKR